MKKAWEEHCGLYMNTNTPPFAVGHVTLCPMCPSSSGLQGPVTVAMNRPQWQGQGCEHVCILNTVCARVCGCVCTSIAC